MTPNIPAATPSRSWMATTPTGLSVSVDRIPRMGRVIKATRKIVYDGVITQKDSVNQPIPAHHVLRDQPLSFCESRGLVLFVDHCCPVMRSSMMDYALEE